MLKNLKSGMQGGNPVQARIFLWNVPNVLFPLYLCCILLKPACGRTPPSISGPWPLFVMGYFVHGRLAFQSMRDANLQEVSKHICKACRTVAKMPQKAFCLTFFPRATSEGFLLSRSSTRAEMSIPGSSRAVPGQLRPHVKLEFVMPSRFRGRDEASFLPGTLIFVLRLS